ncbi:MAG: four helix bundle protein [Dysgonamonadaceae bacterium]|jgi:four helix bundle protein|nr:four helix bundle protein [Dysgonamonadaceae bacterium]
MENLKTKIFKDLVVWQEAHKMTLQVYKVTKKFPREELFGLISQFRRAVMSIPANIAEGYKKKGVADKLRFMNIAQGSLEECRYYIILSKDLDYISEMENVELEELISKTSYLLNSYCSAIIKNDGTKHPLNSP